MKEIKAYIRTNRVEKVVEALKKAGVPGITVVKVHPVGYGFDANYFSTTHEITKIYFEITKLEMVTNDEDSHRFVEIIRNGAYTGSKGDGMIFV
ncbi:MAG TPA: P-II family nitrogen regulator, partial [Bacteroidetes bacterium]|nr:P-II family nitrogen regulator [Bacteroidota bacterium]